MELLEIFIITNGRSTFEYAYKSVEKQSVNLNITVVENLLWVDALNKCASDCQSKYFMRIDDDMFLHQYCIEYYIKMLLKFQKTATYMCKLWEDWSQKPAGFLRAYNAEFARKIKFRASKLGKVDKVFAKTVRKTKFKIIKDISMVGLHALGSIEDQKKYRALWRDKNSKINSKQFAKTFDNKIHRLVKPLSKQYKMLKRIPKYNYRFKTKYYEFLRLKEIS